MADSPYIDCDEVLLFCNVQGASVNLSANWKKRGRALLGPDGDSGIPNIRFASAEDANLFHTWLRTIEYNQPDVRVISSFTPG